MSLQEPTKPKKRVPLGKPLQLSDKDIERMAKVTQSE